MGRACLDVKAKKIRSFYVFPQVDGVGILFSWRRQASCCAILSPLDEFVGYSTV